VDDIEAQVRSAVPQKFRIDLKQARMKNASAHD
jgi:hypothetical protein